MTTEHRANSHGIDFAVSLERNLLLPGRAAEGSVTITPRGNQEVRGVVAALIATEQWKYHEEKENSDGTDRTVTRTERKELQRLPVMLLGPGTFAAGQALSVPFQIPVPSLGPATFDGDVLSLTWKLEIKLDVPGIDPDITIPVVVLQPTGLLVAGVVRLGEFALYEGADVASGSLRGRIVLKPAPLCLGEPFEGVVEFAGAPPSRLTGIRVELKVRPRSTVSGGYADELIVWRGSLPLGSAGSVPISGTLPQQWVPSIELPHGRADATFDIVFDRKLARDEHLVRDVALASTREL